MKNTKYNKSEIMKKANALRKIYGMSKSEALTKAWKMAKLAILENEYFLLNAKSLHGGKNNIVAQIMIRENNAAIDAVNAQIDTLKAQIFPTMKTERKVKLMNPTVSVTFDKVTGKYSETVIEYLTQTNEYLNINAYDAA